MTHLGKRRFFSPQDGIYTRLKTQRDRSLEPTIATPLTNAVWRTMTDEEKAKIIDENIEQQTSLRQFSANYGGEARRDYQEQTVHDGEKRRRI